MPTELILLFKYWYSNQQNLVRWANEYSERYRLDCGVKKGGLSSPKLFNLCINALIEGLSGMSVGWHIGGVGFNNIRYTDDMVCQYY